MLMGADNRFSPDSLRVVSPEVLGRVSRDLGSS